MGPGDIYAMRAERRAGMAVARPSAQSVIKDVGGPKELEDAVEALAEKDPDGYSLLAEHIPLERYRDPRKVGK